MTKVALFVVIFFAFCNSAGAVSNLDQAITSIRDEPIEWQIVFDPTGHEIARTKGEKHSVEAAAHVWLAGNIVLHNHPTPGLWTFSPQDYLFAQYNAIKTMIVVNRIGYKRYRVCTMTRQGEFWDNSMIDYGSDRPLALLDKLMAREGDHQFWVRYAKEYHYTYTCEDMR